MGLCQTLRRFRRLDVKIPGGDETENHCDEGAPLNPKRHVVELFEDFIGGKREDRALPEFRIFMAEEVASNTTPAKIAPIVRTKSGISITIGDSWTWCMTSAEARGLPKKVMNARRQE